MMIRRVILAALLLAPAGPGQEAARDEESGEPGARALKTAITAVTLYSDQALVVRRGSADLPPGRSRWELPGLPSGLRSEAVRARILQGDGAGLANLEVRLQHKTLFKKEEAEEAEKALLEIQSRHEKASNEIAALDREVELLKGFEVGQPPGGKPEKLVPAPIDVKVWEETLKFIDQAYGENRKRARELLRELDGIQEELAVARARARRLSSSKVKAEKAVVLELDAGKEVRAEVEVTYIVPGPGWCPRYDIRADVMGRKLELTSYAMVRQETGEDWEGVELTFSAAEPARAADLPGLLAWHIGEEPPGVQVASSLKQESFSSERIATTEEFSMPQEEQVVEIVPTYDENKRIPLDIKHRARLQVQGGLASIMHGGKAARTRKILENIERQTVDNEKAAERGDWDAYIGGNLDLQEEIQNLDARYQSYFAEDLAQASKNIKLGQKFLKVKRLVTDLVPPVQSSRGFDFKYRALRPETITTDGVYHKVVIAVEEFDDAEFIYEAAPEKRKLFFLTSKIKNYRRQPYLEGPASVFLGPDFIGDGRVPTTARGEEFPVDLGADESISLKRHAERKRETTGLFTSWHKYRHQVEVAVKNQKSRAQRVAVIERIPFTEHGDMEVERLAILPKPAREDRKGLLRWELDLRPGEEKKILFTYTVELPADRRVQAIEDPSVKW